MALASFRLLTAGCQASSRSQAQGQVIFASAWVPLGCCHYNGSSHRLLPPRKFAGLAWRRWARVVTSFLISFRLDFLVLCLGSAALPFSQLGKRAATNGISPAAAAWPLPRYKAASALLISRCREGAAPRLAAGQGRYKPPLPLWACCCGHADKAGRWYS